MYIHVCERDVRDLIGFRSLHSSSLEHILHDSRLEAAAGSRLRSGCCSQPQKLHQYMQRLQFRDVGRHLFIQLEHLLVLQVHLLVLQVDCSTKFSLARVKI